MNDEELRRTLASADPTAGSATVPDLLQRVWSEVEQEPTGWWRRHWQAPLVVAATIATLALGAAVITPDLVPVRGGADIAVGTGPAVGGEIATGEVAPGEVAPEAGAGDRSTVASSATVLVGTDEARQERDRFVARVEELGGQVVSESVITASGSPAMADIAVAGGWYPYPMGPGIYLAVEVPADRFAEALAAASATGEVLRSEQTSFDLGSQVVDLEGRIAALEVSVGRLTQLLQQATSVADVVSVETALSQRQAELDGLRAQQRELTSQTEMARVSLTLMKPKDARASLDPQPPRTWWAAFTEGLAEFWAWLGKALFVLSPLLLAAVVIWWARRRKGQ